MPSEDRRQDARTARASPTSSEFVEPHLGDDVEYLGEVDADGKRELLASAAALLNPISWREPFGMAMLESLACGTPVVGCPQGAAPEIVEHGVTGFLSDSDDELVDALLSIDQIDRTVVSRTGAPSASPSSEWSRATSQVYERQPQRLRCPRPRRRAEPGSRRTAWPTRRAAR